MKNELELREEWMTRARKMTVKELPAFIEELVAHPHDYGTICRAIAAAGVAAAYAVEGSPSGGITGFQASCVRWDLLTGWDESLEKKPLSLIDYENMLYPQYRDNFTSITKEAWRHLQDKAVENLSKEHLHPEVKAHMQSIADGKVPFGFSIRGE